ncbi:MAG: hypothetical protein D6753_03475 [Planctomycetota bacterium]|nr:MAG: hypothetical protein D6753_03475 [Planctomycetota bacterium]
MSSLLRNVLAVVAGVVIGSIVNMVIVMVGPLVVPLPAGVDMSNPDALAENIRLLKPANFLAPWLAHALGTLVGAWVAARVAASHKMRFALGIGAVFLIGGIAMVATIGGPRWFAALDLLGAYLPMAYLGGRLGGAARPSSA